MVVCGACGRVRGPWRFAGLSTDSDSGDLDLPFTQRCECDRRDEPLWPRFDYNTAVHLCWCCAAEAVPSGSRWSLFLCPDCKELAVALMRREGRFIVPIGRHSLMNRVSVTGADLTAGRASATHAARRLVRFGGRITAAAAWGDERALANLAALDVEKSDTIALRDYLRRVAALGIDKAAAFQAMRDYIEDPDSGVA